MFYGRSFTMSPERLRTPHSRTLGRRASLGSSVPMDWNLAKAIFDKFNQAVEGYEAGVDAFALNPGHPSVTALESALVQFEQLKASPEIQQLMGVTMAIIATPGTITVVDSAWLQKLDTLSNFGKQIWTIATAMTSLPNPTPQPTPQPQPQPNPGTGGGGAAKDGDDTALLIGGGAVAAALILAAIAK